MSFPLSSPWRAIWRLKVRLLRGIVTAAGGLLTLAILVQIASRYLFRTSILGIEEVILYLAVWFYFLGAALGAEQREHISASLVDVLAIGETPKRWVHWFASLLAVIICAWMTWWAIGLVEWSWQMNMRSTELRVPVWLIQASIPAGLGLMTFYLLVECADNLRRLVCDKEVA